MLYPSKIRRLKENEKRVKNQLQAVLSPCLGSNTRDVLAPEQAAAKAACSEVLRILKGCEPDTLHSSGAGRYQLAYLNEISELWLALHRQSWTGACNALSDLIHFNLITQVAVRNNTIAVLEQFLI
ncbi:hypothetical protein [Oscillibacter ruminantium]